MNMMICQALAGFPVGDLDRNFIVDFDDLVLFGQQWIQSSDCYGAPGCGDLEGDESVNIEDFALIAQHWQKRGEITLVINEVMASNDSTLEDPDEPGEYPDWIEIYNYGTEEIALTGMYLRDNNNLWQVPGGISVRSGQYILFWADDDDEQGIYHTTLKLDKGSDEVTLLSYDGQTIVDFISFSDQSADISYGRYPDASVNWYTMDSPSASVGNNVGMAGEVYFSRLSGTFTSNFSLTLSAISDTAQIRYTTDGTIPTESSNLYDGPITIHNAQSRRIRARAYEPGLAPGPVTSHYYIPLADDAKEFVSNLPIIVIDSFGENIDNNGSLGCWSFDYLYHPVASVFIEADEDSAIAAITDLPEYAGRAGSRIRGESSRCWPKRQYSLELWDENNTDTKASLFGMPEESDWILNAPYSDKTLMRNVLAYKWANDIMAGFAAPGTRFVELFYNQNGGQCSSADYRGVYVLTEKIKVSTNRVDIGSLTPADNTEPEITGGYLLRVDKNNGQESFYTNANMISSGNGIQYYDPDGFALTNPQKAWIFDYLNEYEAVLNSSDFFDPVEGYADYIDVENFIENDIIFEIFKNSDGFKLSMYFYKEKNGNIFFGPMWDFNFSAGNTKDVYETEGYSWWYPLWFAKSTTYDEGWFNDNMSVYAWHSRLMADSDYMLRTADKWFEHREDKLSDAQITTDIDSYYDLLDSDGPSVDTDSTPADRNFARWNILNTAITCNYYYGNNPQEYMYSSYDDPPQIPIAPEDREQANMEHTYHMEKEWLKNWFNGQGIPASPEWYIPDYTDRMGNLDALWQSDRNICSPPTLSINSIMMNRGGQINIGDLLTMNTVCSGTIYYTTDGTDPRTWTTKTPAVPPFDTVLIAEEAAKAVLVPSGPVNNDWKGGNEPFDDSSWNNYIFVPDKPGSVGYENSSGYEDLISYDVKSYLLGNNNTQSCLIRIPFSVDAGQLPDMTYLILRMRYDDAFVAYINGAEVYRSSLVPDPLEWWSATLDNGWADEAANLVDYDISANLDALQAGSNNILAIHALNSGPTSSDFLISVQLEAGAVSSGDITPGGAISAGAVAYTDAITLAQSTRIKARVKNGSDWGALNEAYYSDNRVVNSLRITEIMYHPADPNHEFIEVQNVGPSAINLAWIKFTDGIDFIFPDMSLASGQYAVVVRNQALFEILYGSGITIAGEFTGALNNGGEEIVLKDAAGMQILDFDYDDDWYPITDGAGFSLNIINPSDPDPNSWDEKNAWRASSVIHGTPGSVNPANIVNNGAIVINEALTHSNSYPNDWIELHNTTGSSINIGGWFLSDNRDNLKKYQIAEGESIPPYGYQVLTQDDNFGSTASDPGRLIGFALSELGEEIYLSSGSGGNLAGGYSVWEDFGASEWDVSFGRHVKSAEAGNDADFVSMQSMTSGSANSGPLVGDVVISEIMYNPSSTHDELGEYIELKNRSGTTVYLYDTSNPSNTWKFTKGIDFNFPAGVSIPAGNRILVVRTDPDIFRVVHPSVPAGVAVYGPFINSKLDNDGEKIELSRPVDPEPGGFVPYIRVEQVNYSDGAHPIGEDPWPTSPDNHGDSLNRVSENSYPNDVGNWTAASPSPGT